MSTKKGFLIRIPSTALLYSLEHMHVPNSQFNMVLYFI